MSESFRNDTSERIRRIVEGLVAGACDLQVAPEDVIRELTDGRSLGSVVGLVRLPGPRALGELIREAKPRPATLLVAMDVEEPGNVGALVRTGLASGAAAFLAVGASDAFHPKAVRTSMGGVFKLPIVHYREPGPLLGELASRGVTTVGATAAEGVPLPLQGFGSGPLAVILGSEAFGLSPELLQAMDQRVTIPMASDVDSFSVNAAAAVLLYEIRLRREAATDLRGEDPHVE